MPSRITAAAQSQPSPRLGPTIPTVTFVRSSHRSLVSMVLHESLDLLEPHSLVLPSQESNLSSDDNPLFLPLRNDIFPCMACAEIFPKPHMQQQLMKHAMSELTGEDSGQNIVKIIFKTGWTNKDHSSKIDRILKIHNSSKILTHFEEYRELVKSNAVRSCAAGRRRGERHSFCACTGRERGQGRGHLRVEKDHSSAATKHQRARARSIPLFFVGEGGSSWSSPRLDRSIPDLFSPERAAAAEARSKHCWRD
ncbi:hypothetical protein CDL15_Pgr005832 [Punica granatum]|uniref:C2H2-type domain-containing protein n=1 Tax=Punica granatum TaxID=22663 RepID=A0A218WFL9_PUNGR|nr:hypothetical protein CDL15_Pgr005832 [Punica granatum]